MTATESSPASGSSPLGTSARVVLTDDAGGIGFIPASAPIIGVNYYDGRLLRAEDLNIERWAQRAYAELANRAGGAGVVSGFDLTRSDTSGLNLSAGLAIDPKGRVLYLPDGVGADAAALVAAATASMSPQAPAGTGPTEFTACETAVAPPTTATVGSTSLYLVGVVHIEGLCGELEVFGRLCDDACTTATDRPFVVDGVALVLVPLVLRHDRPSLAGVTNPDRHLRSQVAASFFADEWEDGASLLSAAGLRSPVWCAGAAPAAGGDLVPLGILGWDGSAITVFDEWTARRERMEAPPRSYWAGRTELRPWPVFLAQVLQFQCQFAELGAAIPSPVQGLVELDPQRSFRDLLDQSQGVIDELRTELGKSGGKSKRLRQRLEHIDAFRQEAGEVLAAASPAEAEGLVELGFVELPPAGYLPIDTDHDLAVGPQVQQLLGSGVDLHVCAVRRDQIAHELERAQHMDRISLIDGLRDPAQRQDVDILVPDGRLETSAKAPGLGFALDVSVGLDVSRSEAGERERIGDILVERRRFEREQTLLPLVGAGRLDFDDGIHAQAVGGATSPEGVKALITVLIRAFEEPDRSRSGIDKLREALEHADFGTDRVAVDRLRRAGVANFRHLGGLAGARSRLGDEPEAEPTDAVTERSRLHRVGLDSDAVWDTQEEDRLPGMSIDLWVARDPFAVEEGDDVPFRLTFELFVAAGRRPVALTYDIFGALVPRRRFGTELGEALTVTLRGAATVEVHGVARSTEREELPSPMLLHRGVIDGRQVLGLSDPELNVFVALGWKDSPIHAVGTVLGFRQLKGGRDPKGTSTAVPMAAVVDALRAAFDGVPAGKRAVELGHGLGVEDPDVNRPGNAHHDAAVAALQILSNLHQDEPTFAERRVRELFPPQPPSTTTIHPTTDWVLFRRRRHEACEGTVAPPSAPPSRVTPWLARAKSREQAEAWTRALEAGRGDDIELDQLDGVSFVDGSTQLVTEASVWQSRYQTAAGGQLVHFAGYAPATGSANLVFGAGRAKALVEACGQVASFDPHVLYTGAPYDIVPAPPAGTSLPGDDASIFLLTFDEVDDAPAHVCVEVYAVNTATKAGQELEQLIIDEDAAGVAGHELSQGGRHVLLTEVEDDPDTLDERVAQIKEQLDALTHGLEAPDDGTAQFTAHAWLQGDIAGEEREATQRHLRRLLEALLEASVWFDAGPIEDVSFETGGCPARVYLVYATEKR